MRVLLALGGNAMTAPDGRADVASQLAAIDAAMEQVVELLAEGIDVVITHGNGPQVGDLLAQGEVAAESVPPLPLDLCGAATQGSIGAMILNALQRHLANKDVARRPAALVTRTEVAADDPGFQRPTKPVGRFVSAAEAAAYIALGQVWEDRGPRGWRRIVASPEPVRVLESDAVLALSRQGFVVVAAGGGGMPVVAEDGGGYRGVEAVIDKDLTAALLARTARADALCIATDVPRVMLHFGTPQERSLERVTASELRRHAAEGHFASGSMGPKVEAALRFVESGGSRSIIGSLGNLKAAVLDDRGTVVVPDSD